MQHIQSHPASVEAYIKQGLKLVPIPPGTKGPQHKGWNQWGNELKEASDLHSGWGIGLLHSFSGTCAIDIDNWTYADSLLKEHGIDLSQIYNADDAVTIESGREGRGKLIYRLPFGIAFPSKKIHYKDAHNSNQVAYELRCGTVTGLTAQDVLPPSIHPITQQPYQWGGKGHWSRIPQLPKELETLWWSLVEQDKQRTIKNETNIDASWEEIQQAMGFISPDVSRDEWLHIGMALHHTGTHTGDLNQALYIWNEWSQAGTKYQGKNDILTCWQSFKADSGISLGTLFHIAGSYGWTRPIPDASELFSSINEETPPQSPVNVIDGLRPPSPNLDLQYWPDVLATRAQEVGDQVGCDPLVPLFAGLGALAGAVDAQTRLELVPGFEVPPIVWLMTVGDPADKKSPGSRPMMEILEDLEEEDRPRFSREMLQWEAKEVMYNESKKAFLEYAADPTSQMDNDTIPAVPDLESKPVPLKLTVQDVTSQKLVHLAAERDRGLLCYLDEMNSWVKKMTNKWGAEDRSTWVVGYEGKKYTMDRIGTGNIRSDNFAISIYGNIQPQVFRDNINNLADDGLVQRFIPAILRSNMTKLGQPVPDALTTKSVWDQCIRTAYSLQSQKYTLSPAAYKRFREFQAWYEGAKQDERIVQSDKAYRTAFGKLEGTAGRLMLLFHIIETPYNNQVDVSIVDKVIAVIKTYIIPAYRYTLGEIGGYTDDSLDVWLTNHVIHLAGQQETISLSQIKRSGRRNWENLRPWQIEEQVRLSMSMLQDNGWVVLVEDKATTGHVVWSINPLLVEQFQDYRTAVIKAKQRTKDLIYHAGLKKGKGDRGNRPLIPGYDPETMDDPE